MPTVDVRVLSGPDAGTRVTMSSDSFVVGRSLDADLPLSADTAISRHHCAIEWRDEHLVVVDLGSANGTWADDQPVESAVRLVPGSTIELGSSLLRVDWQPAPPSSPLRTPRFPGYRVVERLGEGNMGEVVLAERVADGRRFAIKTLRRDAALEPSDAQRFLREADSLRALDHPNIVGFVDQGFVDDAFYLVMQHVEGVDLDIYRRQAGGYVPVGRCVDLVCQVLDGLAYAHRKGFVHRDIKPANILVGVEEGRMTPKLTDFGLAKRYENAGLDNVTRGRIALGTPDYMPPEQVLEFRTVGPASDIYSVGATVYHLLSGDPLYAGLEGSDPIRTLLDSDPPPLRERAPWVPPRVAEVVQRAIRRAPDDRWAGAASFRDALRLAWRQTAPVV